MQYRVYNVAHLVEGLVPDASCSGQRPYTINIITAWLLSSVALVANACMPYWHGAVAMEVIFILLRNVPPSIGYRSTQTIVVRGVGPQGRDFARVTDMLVGIDGAVPVLSLIHI